MNKPKLMMQIIDVLDRHGGSMPVKDLVKQVMLPDGTDAEVEIVCRDAGLEPEQIIRFGSRAEKKAKE